MKYNQFYNKEEDRSHLFFGASISSLGMDLYTSVVNSLPKMIPHIIEGKRLEEELQITSKNSREVVINYCSAFHKVCVS